MTVVLKVKMPSKVLAKLKLFYSVSLLLLSTTSVLGSPLSDSRPGDEPRRGAVASSSNICSSIGTRLLQDGGNAVDATVGTVLCVGVVSMYHSGIGGGGFALIRAPNGTYEHVDFRETAPAAAYEDMYRNDTNLSLFGGLASGVPGELRGLEYMHKRYGVLPWKNVVSPAVKVARYGFVVNADTVRYMESASPGGGFLTNDPSWALDFAPNGRRVQLGETLSRKRYADTLETIAEQGADAFYSGAIASATIAAIRRANGTMTLADLRNYTIALRQPVRITYRGYKLTSCGAPAGGGVALTTLNILNGYKPGENSNLSVHRLNEALRFAYGARANLGDPSFVTNLNAYQTNLLSSTTAAEIRAKISDDKTHEVAYYNPSGLESLETPGTSQISASDASGLTVSLTSTINTLFGSQLMVPETGVILNNEMNDFSIPGSSNAFGYIPSPANYIRPGKRPLSSISPVIAEPVSDRADGKGKEKEKVLLAVGAAGGSRIITSTVQNIIHVLDEGLSLPNALAQPRLHDQLMPAVTTFEWTYDNRTVEYLRGLGHNVTWVAPGQSSAQAVRRWGNGTFEAAGEPRQVASGGFAV